MAEQASKRNIDNMIVLMVNIQGCQLLLPDAAVAEIVEFQSTDSSHDEMPTWYLGQLPWRGLEVPLVSLEGLNSDAFFSHSRNLKIIILHSSSQRDQMPYWAFVAKETPRMSRLDNDRLEAHQPEQLQAMEKMWAIIDGEAAMIPDMAKVELAISQLLF